MTASAFDLKVEGNKAFGEGDFQRAAKLYREGLTLSDSDELSEILQCNLAAVLIKLAQYDDALAACDSSLTINPANVKARYRRAQALAALNRQAEAASEAARLASTGDSAAKELYGKLRQEETARSAAMDCSDEPLEPIREFHYKCKNRLPFTSEEEDATANALNTMRTSMFHRRTPGYAKALVPIAFDLISVDKSNNSWKVKSSAARLLTVLLAPTLDEEVITRCKKEGKEVLPDVLATAAGEELRKCEGYSPAALRQIFHQLIRAGVGNKTDDSSSSSDSAAVYRTTTASALADITRYIGSLEEQDFLDLLCIGISCVESDPVAISSIYALASLAVRRQRQGSRVVALRNTQALSRVIETVVVRLDENSEECEKAAEAALASVLCLLADKDRNPTDEVSVVGVANELLVPHVGTAAGTKALLILASADRKAFATLASEGLAHKVLELATAIGGTSADAELLGSVLESIEGRTAVLAADGDVVLVEAVGRTGSLPLAVALTKLCLHDTSLVEANPELLDAAVAAAANCTQESLRSRRQMAELLCFLAMHAKAKKALLESGALKRIFDCIVKGEETDGIHSFFVASALLRLFRSREDKERVSNKKQPGGPDLDDEQRKALAEFFEKLPSHSKPTPNGVWDLGSPELAQEVTDAVQDAAITFLVRLCSSRNASSGQLAAAVDAFLLLCRDHTKRPLLVARGALTCLLAAVPKLEGDEPSDANAARQAMAQLLIATNPRVLTYNERLSCVSALMPMLNDSYELLQYEAALALTNLLSDSDEARCRAFYGGAWNSFFNLATSENDLCRAAGLEGMCNMVVCDPALQHIANGRAEVELQILLCFLGEAENPRAQTAAAGCLAMMSSDSDCAMKVLESKHVENVVKWYGSNADLDQRLKVIAENIWNAVQDKDNDHKAKASELYNPIFH